MSENNVSEQYAPTINKEELAPGIVVYKDVIPGHHQLIPYIEQIVAAGMAQWSTEKIQENEVYSMAFAYPVEFRDPNDFSVVFEERISLVIAGFLGFVENQYVSENLSSQQMAHDYFNLIKYEKGVSFSLAEYPNDNSIIVLYFLNDDYEGSILEFENLGISYQPKANEALILPSAKGYEYSISKLASGTKYVVVSYLRKERPI